MAEWNPNQTILTPGLTDVILGYVREGNTQRDVAALVHVHVQTLKGWLKKGRSGDPKYQSFSNRYSQAEAECSRGVINILLQKVEADPKIGQWFLEKRRWKDYDRRATEAHLTAKAQRESNLQGLSEEQLADAFLAMAKSFSQSDNKEASASFKEKMVAMMAKLTTGDEDE